MKQSDIRIGSTYETRVSGELVKVEVLNETSMTRVTMPGERSARSTFRVRRIDTGVTLPKARTAAALHEIREMSPALTSGVAGYFERMGQAMDRANYTVAAWRYYQRAQNLRMA